ncbi:Glutathione S-transferase 1 [Nymphon striatum]|nr:Glutathione S-transferase 1 [Nymphon striatum]
MSSMELVIGNKNYSTWSLRPWFFLKNLDIEFKEKMVFLFKDDTNDILKPYFSNDKVPVLVDDDLQIWDTLAIIEYVADKYPEKLGWPTDAKAKAIARSASAEMHSSFMALRNALPMNIKKHFPDYPISNEVKLDIQRIFDIWDYCKQNATEEGPWLMGRFSGVDAMYAPVVMRLIGYDVKLAGFAAEYADTVLNNQHMQEWMKAGKQETQIISFDEV